MGKYDHLSYQEAHDLLENEAENLSKDDLLELVAHFKSKAPNLETGLPWNDLEFRKAMNDVYESAWKSAKSLNHRKRLLGPS